MHNIARKNRAGTASATSVKSPAAAGANVSWRQRAAPGPGNDGIGPLNDPAAAHAALIAFLRGIERRGAVFAHWQGGSPEAGDAALAATLRGFAGMAAGVAFAEWPRRFWAMLLAAPQLRDGVRPVDPDVPAPVATLATGPRAALLLRVVAGLAESEAAAVLGIGRPTYRLALQRALPRREDGSPDPEAWRALSTAARQAVRELPDARLVRIRSLRDGVRPSTARPARAARVDRRPGWLWPATAVVVLGTAVALAATWWGPWAPAHEPVPPGTVRSESLPPAAPPAARFDPDTLLASHRDLGLLLAQVTDEFDEDADPAFDAWLVHALADQAVDVDADGGNLEPAGQAPEDVDASP